MCLQHLHDREGQHTIMGTSLGCLCKIDGSVPGVTKKPSWQQGFAKVYSDKEHFNLHHYYINQGKCIYNGDIYQGVDYTNNIKELLSV